MTCCTTLLADYFHGTQRDRYFGLQVVYTTVAATIFFAVGGALGRPELAGAVLALRRQPAVGGARRPLHLAAGARAGTPAQKLPPLPRRHLVAPVGVSLIGGLIFYVLIVELAFKLDDIGVESTATIGAVSAVASLGTAAGAFLFGRLARLGAAVTVPLAFALSGIGLIGLALAPGVPTIVVSAVVTGVGNGLLLPALSTWALGTLTFEQRGRGTGIWTSALFIGQFVCPLAVLGLSGALSGLNSALLVLGAVAVISAVGVRLAGSRRAVDPAPAT